MAQDFTTQLKVRQFIHDPDDYDDMFESVETYSQVENLAAIHLDSEQLTKFKVYIYKRLENIPLDMLRVSQQILQKKLHLERPP